MREDLIQRACCEEDRPKVDTESHVLGRRDPTIKREKEEEEKKKINGSEHEEVTVANNVTVHNQLYVTTRESPCESNGGRKPEPQVHCIGDFISDPLPLLPFPALPLISFN